jgi:hypothetical protein
MKHSFKQLFLHSLCMKGCAMTHKTHLLAVVLFSLTMFLKIFSVIALCSLHADVELAHEGQEEVVFKKKCTVINK